MQTDPDYVVVAALVVEDVLGGHDFAGSGVREEVLAHGDGEPVEDGALVVAELDGGPSASRR